MNTSTNENRNWLNRRSFLKRSVAGALACGFAFSPQKALAGLDDLTDLLTPIRQQFGVPSCKPMINSISAPTPSQ